MKIVFLNTWSYHEINNIKTFLKEQSKDTNVFCLQEVGKAAREMYKNIFSNYNEIFNFKDMKGDDDFHEATYIKNDMEIVSNDYLLKEMLNVGTALNTKIKYNNELINICNVHGTPRPKHKDDTKERIKQSQEILSFFQGLDEIKIIGGDFNLDPHTESIEMFEKNGYVNLIKKYKIPTTRNNLAWNKYPNNKQLFADYVFIKPDLNINKFSVPNLNVSDHLPMILDLNV